MQITDIKVRKLFDEGPMKAIVSVTFDGQLAVHDIKATDIQFYLHSLLIRLNIFQCILLLLLLMNIYLLHILHTLLKILLQL